MGFRRPDIGRRIQKRLFQEAQSMCPECGNSDIDSLVIHHIKRYADTKEHHPEHMIVLCRNCHEKADLGNLSPERLYSIKSNMRHQPSSTKVPTVLQNVAGMGNVAVAGNINTIRVGKGKVTVSPLGTVCEDPRKVGYLQYLAKRCIEFRAADPEYRGDRRPAAIHGQYRSYMKYAIKTTPLDQFDKAVTFLQESILKTRLGRVQRARGQAVFSSFNDFDVVQTRPATSTQDV